MSAGMPERESLLAGEREWVDLFASRNEVAEEYAVLMRRWAPTDYRWSRINEAIIDRWSISGLEYIKRRAWTIAETGRA